jgi:hypothetical protein
MISDAYVRVECDAPHCRSSLEVDLEAGVAHTYLYSEDRILRQLRRDEWIVEGEAHYCCEECVPEQKRGAD